MCFSIMCWSTIAFPMAPMATLPTPSAQTRFQILRLEQKIGKTALMMSQETKKIWFYDLGSAMFFVCPQYFVECSGPLEARQRTSLRMRVSQESSLLFSSHQKEWEENWMVYVVRNWREGSCAKTEDGCFVFQSWCQTQSRAESHSLIERKSVNSN